MKRIKMQPGELTVRDHFARGGKVLSWLTYAIVAIVLIVFGAIHIIAGFLPESPVANYILPEIFQAALEQAQDADPGERGDYFNFLIGVPLAAAGSAVAAVVAASAKSVANRQRLVQEMALVDSKLTARSTDFLELVNALDDLHERGSQLQWLVRKLLKTAEEENIHPLSMVRDDIYPAEGIITEGPEVDKLRDHFRPRIRNHLEAIRTSCSTVFDKFQVLTFDPFWARAIEVHGNHVSPEWPELEIRMRKELGKPVKPREDWSPRAISRQLRQWTLQNDLDDAIMGFIYLPDDATPLEFVGGIIRLETASGEFPRYEVLERWDRGDRSTFNMYNLGAASIYTLFRAMPSQDALRNTVFNLFPNLDTYESRGYFQSLPNKDRITNDDMLAAIHGTYEAPGSLIYKKGMTPETVYLRPERLEAKANADRRGKKGQTYEKSSRNVLRMKLRAESSEISRPQPPKAPGAEIMLLADRQAKAPSLREPGILRRG